MEHIEFSNKLKEIALSRDEYLSLGYSEKFTQEMIDSFSVRYRNGKSTPEYDDPIKNLVTTFDCTTVEIGMICFNGGLEERGSYTVFGRFEGDDLAISEITKEVIMLETEIQHVLYHCASNSSNFLEALLIMAAFLQKRATSDELYEDEQANLLVAENCAKIAGGEKYFDFYRMMLGF